MKSFISFVFALTLLAFIAGTPPMGIIASSIRPPAGGYDADAQRYFDSVALTDVLTTAQKNAVNQLVLSYKANGFWARQTAIYNMAGGTANAHKWNLKNPGTYTLTFVGSPVHDATGMTLNGTSQYASTGIIPSSVLSLNDNHIAYWSGTNTTAAGGEMGCTDAGAINWFYIVCGFSDGNAYYFNNSTGYKVGTAGSTNGLFVNSRVSSTDFMIYKNGAAFTATNTGSVVSSSLVTTYDITIGRVNNSSFYSTKTCAGATIGGGITTGEQAAYYSMWQTYQTAMSR